MDAPNEYLMGAAPSRVSIRDVTFTAEVKVEEQSARVQVDPSPLDHSIVTWRFGF